MSMKPEEQSSAQEVDQHVGRDGEPQNGGSRAWRRQWINDLLVVVLLVFAFAGLFIYWPTLHLAATRVFGGDGSASSAQDKGVPMIAARDFPSVRADIRGDALPGSVVVIDSGAIAAEALSDAVSGQNAPLMGPRLGDVGKIVGAVISAKAMEYSRAGLIVLSGGTTVLAAPQQADKTEEVRAAVRAELAKSVAQWQAAESIAGQPAGPAGAATAAPAR